MYAWIFVLGHYMYLFLGAHSFISIHALGKLLVSLNCREMWEPIFVQKGGYCLFILCAVFAVQVFQIPMALSEQLLYGLL